jgi:hypothetical protein
MKDADPLAYKMDAFRITEEELAEWERSPDKAKVPE